MIKINNLHANIEGKEILKGLTLEVKAGEIHAIMGPNGAGKSTLASILAGREEYEVTEGSVDFDGTDLLEMDTEDRAREGLFLAFQYPVEIPGVSNINFLRTAFVLLLFAATVSACVGVDVGAFISYTPAISHSAFVMRSWSIVVLARVIKSSTFASPSWPDTFVYASLTFTMFSTAASNDSALNRACNVVFTSFIAD